MGALRLWTPFVGFALENGTQTIGRLKLLVFSQGIVFFAFLFMFFIDFGQYNTTLRIIGTISVIIGYSLESGLVWIAYKLYTTELFPTCIRSIALSTFSSTSLFGSFIAPQIVYFSKFWHPAPYAGACIASGLSVILSVAFLPETRYVALPETMSQAKNRKRLYKEDSNTIPQTLSDKKNINQKLI